LEQGAFFGNVFCSKPHHCLNNSSCNVPFFSWLSRVHVFSFIHTISGASASASFFWMLLFGSCCMLVLPHIPLRVFACSIPHPRPQCIAPFVKIPFLSYSLTFMCASLPFPFGATVADARCRMVYVYGRRNEGLRMTFLHLFTFRFFILPAAAAIGRVTACNRAPYLPWVLLGFSFLLGSFSPGVRSNLPAHVLCSMWHCCCLLRRSTLLTHA